MTSVDPYVASLLWMTSVDPYVAIAPLDDAPYPKLAFWSGDFFGDVALMLPLLIVYNISYFDYG
jgi:hypothetical protein